MAGIDSFTKLMLQLNNDVLDTETAGPPKVITNTNVTFSNASYPYSTQYYVGVFNGTNAFLDAGDSNDFYFGTGDFTIDYFINYSSITNEMVTASQRADGSNQWFLDKNPNAGGNKLEITFIFAGSTKADYIMTNAWAVSLSTWYHIQWVRFGTTILLFINGISQAMTELTAISTNDVGNVGANLLIGKIAVGGGLFSAASIAGFRVSKGTARNTTNFTPPTSPYSANPLSILTTRSNYWGDI